MMRVKSTIEWCQQTAGNKQNTWSIQICVTDANLTMATISAGATNDAPVSVPADTVRKRERAKRKIPMGLSWVRSCFEVQLS